MKSLFMFQTFSTNNQDIRMKKLTLYFLLLISCSFLPADEACSDCSDCERFVAFMKAGKDYMNQAFFYEALS